MFGTHWHYIHSNNPLIPARIWQLLLMQQGLAEILLIGKTTTRIQSSIPRKHGQGVEGYNEHALNKFFVKMLEAFIKHVDFNVVRCAVIASPDFTKDQFHLQLLLEAESRKPMLVIENKSRILLVHTSSGDKHSLKEVLDAPDIMSIIIKDTKAAQGMRALEDFFGMLSKDPAGRACYGLKHVEVAHERVAVKTLLITDQLFRNNDAEIRQKYVDLVKSARDLGDTTAYVFSSMHVSGEQLEQLTRNRCDSSHPSAGSR